MSHTFLPTPHFLCTDVSMFLKLPLTRHIVAPTCYITEQSINMQIHTGLVKQSDTAFLVNQFPFSKNKIIPLSFL